MVETAKFISELIRAANEVERLTDFEKRRLLERAVTTIRDMRELVGIQSANTKDDAIIDLQATAIMSGLGTVENERMSAALLNAAGMIRDLHIVLDANTEIQIGDGGSNG